MDPWLAAAAPPMRLTECDVTARHSLRLPPPPEEQSAVAGGDDGDELPIHSQCHSACRFAVLLCSSPSEHRLGESETYCRLQVVFVGNKRYL